MAAPLPPCPNPGLVGLELRAANWRQGSVIANAALRAADAIPPEESRDAIIVSHDCDLLSHDLDKEPYVEVVFFTLVPASRPLETAALHARQLALSLTDASGRDADISLCVHDRLRLDRRVLLRCAPDTRWRVGDEARFILAEWMARRYQRPSFPDAFNDRLRRSKAQDALRSLMRRKGSLAEQILVQLDTDAELPDGAPYRVGVAVVVTRTVADSPEARARVERELYEPIVEALENSTGIEVVGAVLVGEHLFTLERAGEFQQWHPDSLSSLAV
jgi:hypothetical protein